MSGTTAVNNVPEHDADQNNPTQPTPCQRRGSTHTNLLGSKKFDKKVRTVAIPVFKAVRIGSLHLRKFGPFLLPYPKLALK